MSVDNNPAFQFYVKDYLTDTNLMACSDAAQGIWMRILCLMWLADDRGKLPDDIHYLSRVLGRTPDYLTALLDELCLSKTFSREGKYIVNRRMLRQANLKQTRQKVGKLGGLKRVANQKAYEISLSKPPSKIQAKSSPASSSPSPLIDIRSPTLTILPKIQKAPRCELSPIGDGCVYFRISEREKVEVQEYYRKRNFPLNLIPYAVRSVEEWLAGDGKEAIKARKASTHHERLKADWVISKALDGQRTQKKLDGPTNIGEAFKEKLGFIPSYQERSKMRKNQASEEYLREKEGQTKLIEQEN